MTKQYKTAIVFTLVAVFVTSISYILIPKTNFISPKIRPKASEISDFNFIDTNNISQKLSDYEDKTIIFNFWASWCAPCIKEMPILIEAASKYPDTVLIALSSDMTGQAMSAFLDKYQYQSDEHTIFAFDKDQSITAEKFKITRLPQTYILKPGLKTVAHLRGANWSADDLQKILKNQ
ncbi:MAG: TlpA family protein disulfide reductase [Micavibrio sp.]|nr:TlpA family protein disulfide reductase [Micavibrio sp.]